MRYRYTLAGLFGRPIWRVRLGGLFGGSIWPVYLGGPFGGSIWRIFLAGQPKFGGCVQKESKWKNSRRKKEKGKAIAKMGKRAFNIL